MDCILKQQIQNIYIITNYRDSKNQFCSTCLKLLRNLVIKRDRYIVEIRRGGQHIESFEQS